MANLLVRIKGYEHSEMERLFNGVETLRFFLQHLTTFLLIAPFYSCKRGIINLVIKELIFMMLVAIIALILFVLFLSLYNSLVRKRNKCDEAFSTMDVYMKKRFDLIPNLVETVKGYAKHEAETLEKIIAKRNSGQMSTDQRMENEQEITGAVRQIFALAENYPDLKANQNFINLQNQLTKAEEDIANSRKFYNAIVREYNDACQTIPSNIVATIFGFERKTMYEATDTERENVQVSF